MLDFFVLWIDFGLYKESLFVLAKRAPMISQL